MLTQGKIDQFYKDVNSLELKYPVAEIQRATKFPKSNVSEWLSKKKVPSEKFIDTFYSKFKNELAKGSINIPPTKGQDLIINNGDGSIMLIELKTASGKIIQVRPQGVTDVALLNAFLEERDRVIDTLKEEKQARIDELIKEKENLNNIIQKYLAEIHSNSREIRSDLESLIPEVQAEHRAIMDSIDKAAKQPIGTTAAMSDKLELSYHEERAKKGKKVEAGK